MSSARARYRIVRPLVGGGNAEVFEALAHGELGFTRRVAIKKLRAELAADADAVRAFIDEAKLVSRLHHANIVGVVDVGTLDGAPFQVLELVDGPDLRTLVEDTRAQGRALTPELALHVAIEVAHALDHAHRAVGPSGRPLGIVHRDVSPDNILVSEAGDVKLADFGIAKQDDDAPKTRVGVAKGKPSYMAPEQHLGARLDARTDLFALGLVLHFVLAGRSPLEGDGARRAVIAGDPVPLDPALPADLAELVRRCVANRVDQRFDGASAFLREAARTLAVRGWIDGRSELRAVLAARRRDTPTPRQLHPLEQMWMMDVLLENSSSGVPRYTSVLAPAASMPPRTFEGESSSNMRLDEPDPATVARTELAMPLPSPRRGPTRALRTEPVRPSDAVVEDEPATLVPFESAPAMSPTLVSSSDRRASEAPAASTSSEGRAAELPPPLPRAKPIEGIGRVGPPSPVVVSSPSLTPLATSPTVPSTSSSSSLPRSNVEVSIPPMVRASSSEASERSLRGVSAGQIVEPVVAPRSSGRFGIALGALVLAVFTVAIGAIAMRAGTAPREIDLAPVNEAEPPIGAAVAATATPTPAPTPAPTPPPPTDGQPSRLRDDVPRATPRPSVSPRALAARVAEQRRALDELLAARGLRPSDLEELSSTRAPLAAWRTARMRTDEADLEASFDALTRAAERAQLDGDVLTLRLSRLKQRLEGAADVLPADVLAGLERRYLDARTRVGQRVLSPRELNSLGAALVALEADLADALRAAQR